MGWKPIRDSNDRDQTNIIVPINSDKYESSYKYDKPEDGYKMAYYNRSSGGNNKNSLFASKYERSGDNREMEEHYLEEQIILRPGGAVQKIIVPALHETTKAITETKQEHYISGGTKYPKPYFKVHLKDQNNLVEGQPVHLECRVEPKSDPHLKIDWYFDNSPLKTDKRVHTVYDYGYASLSITESSAPADSGIYVARASNQAGEAYSTASLCLAPLKSIITETQTTTQFDELEMEKFIYDADRDRPVLGEDKEVQAYLRTSVIRPKFSKPTFTSRFEDTLYYRDGDRIKLEANLVPLGDKSLKIEWLKNGEPLVLNARTQTFHENGRVGLEIYPAEVFDEGIYTCQATSDNGYAAISTRLKYIPERAPIYHYQDGKKFVEEEEEGVAPMLTPGDMSIKKPRVPKKRPCFKSDLKGIDLEEGQGIHLEAKLEPLDDSNLKVDWFKDGQPLKESPKIKAGQDKGKVYLDMDDMKPKDSGVYKCKASNDFGEAIISAPITVHPKTPIPQAPEPDQVSDYWWRDKYPPLKKPAPLSPAPFSPIIINKKKRQPPPPPPQEEEDLEFIKGQSRENRRFDTEVDLPPRFITDISDLQANEWDKIRFEARLEPANDKTTQIFWYHDGKILNASSRIKTLFDYGVVILEITDITTKDAGLYECIATNNFGSDSTRAILTVREDDERIIQDTGLSSQRSSVARVKDIEETVERTIIELYPPPETLLKSFKEDDYTSGQRIYKVENEYVTDGSTFYDKRPIFLTELNDVRVKKHDTIRLEAKVVPSIKEDNSLQVGWYKNGKLILIEESSERIQIFNDANSGFAVLEIRDAQTSDSGEYVCVVRNSNGQALSKCKVVCKDDHFGEPPFFVNRYMRLDNLNEGDTAHVEFRLEPAEDQNMKVEWFFNGQPLQRGYRTKTLHDFGYTILDISPIYAENSGVYECKATNHYGTKTAVAVVDCKGKRDAKWDTHIPSQTSDQDQTTRRRTEQEQHWISKADLTLNQPKIRLQRKPVFTTPLHKFTNLKEGDSCHFVTTIEPADDDRLQIQWFLDGKLISQENRIKMVHNFGYVVLDISPVKVCDTGIYTCVAKNDFGEDTVSGTLHCKAFEQIAPPKFRVPLKNLEVYEGETAHFKAILEPNFDPNLKVEWFFEDKPILGSTRFRPHSDGNLATLDITPAYSEDSGTYKLVAVNAEGRQSAASAATLKCYPRPVPPRPSFLAPLTLASPMKKGWPALIETRVIPGLGSDLEIEWSINGTPLQALNRDKYRFVRDAASGYVGLHICASQISNSGRYTVLARNETGSDSISANFEVEKEEDEKREEAIYVSRFKTHIYPAKEKEISTIEKKEIETKEVITSTTTIVSEAPKFSKKLEPINTVVGKSAIFSVLFNGNPPPQVIWKRENYEIHNSPDFIITTTNTSSTLIIKKVCIEDTGTISCNILNTAGWAESSAKLNVEKPHIEIKREDLERTETVAIIETIPTAPRIIQPLRDCITTQGQSAFFQCTIYGYPAPQIEWFKNDQPLQTTSSGPQSPPYISVTATESKEVSGNYIFTLKLAECYLEDEGVYSCRLTNPSGSITTSATLKVQQFRPDTEGPSFIRSLESTRVIEGTPITFSCILTGKPKPAILWFKDGSEIKPSSKYQITYTGTNCKLTVQNCQESDNGTYMCKAQNASGTAECSAALLVERREFEEKDKVAPQILTPLIPQRVNEGQYAYFKCQFSLYPYKSIVWTKDDIVLRTSIKCEILYDNGISVLRIMNVNKSDEGIYTCKALSEEFDLITAASLQVFEKSPEPIPEVVHPLAPIMVKESETAILSCKITGTPELRLSWYHGPTVLEPIPGKYDISIVDDKAEMKIYDINQFDQGEYTCKGKTPSGEVSTSSYIKIKETSYDETIIYETKTDNKKIQEIESDVDKRSSNVIDSYHENRESSSERPRKKMRGDYEVTVTIQPDSLSPFTKSPSAEYEIYTRKSLEVDEEENSILTSSLHSHERKRSEHPNYKDISVSFQSSSNTSNPNYDFITISSERSIPIVQENFNFSSPLFVETLKNIKQMDGHSACFECKITGSPIPQICWYRNNKIIEDSKDFRTLHRADGTCVLFIAELFPEDEGVYICEATNSFGTANTAAELIVEKFTYLPDKEEASITRTQTKSKRSRDWSDGELTQYTKRTEIMTSYEDNTYAQVSDEELARGPVDFTPPELPIDLETSFPLPTLSTTRSITETQSTTKEDEEIIMVQIVYPPLKFKVKLPDQVTTHEDETIIFRVKSPIGGPLIQISWYKNGKYIQPDKHTTYSSGESDIEDFKVAKQDEKSIFVQETSSKDEIWQELIINKLSKEDEGIYECRAINGFGERDDTSTNLKVVLNSPTIEETFKEYSVDIGSKLVIDVNLTSSHQDDVNVLWKKDGIEIYPNDHYVIIGKAGDSILQRKLMIPCVQSTDEGIYTCFINEYQIGPKIKIAVLDREPFIKDVKIGTKLELILSLPDEPNTVLWEKDGAIINQQTSNLSFINEGKKVKIVFEKFDQNDQGLYTCKWNNKETKIKLFGKPVFSVCETPRVQEKVIEEGQDLELCVSIDPIETRTPDTVEWRKDGIPIKNLTQYGKRINVVSDKNYDKLFITSAKTMDSGIYECFVGENSIKISVTVNKSPDTIQTYKIIEEGSKIIISLNLPSKCDSLIWEKDGIPIDMLNHSKCKIIVDDNNTNITIPRASLEDSGVYTCVTDGQNNNARIIIQNVQPPTKHLKEGSNLELMINLPETRNVEWLKDGRPLTLDSRSQARTTPENNSILIIKNIKMDDAGVYSCIFKDQEIKAKIIVEEKEKRAERAILSNGPIAGDDIEIRITLPHKAAYVTWRRENDGKVIKSDDTESSKFTMKTENEGLVHVLLIKNISPCDDGNYICEYGQKEYLIANITVKGKF
ncbi:unnamed protein product [Gordionus sp. m RMFG-2023]